MLKFLIEAFKASKGRMPNNMEMILLRQKAAKQSIDERKVVSMFDRSAVNPNKPILGGKNIPETEDDIRRRLMKQNEQGIKSLEERMKKNKEYQDLKKSFDDPEKKAMGGRIGYSIGDRVMPNNDFMNLGLTNITQGQNTQTAGLLDMFKDTPEEKALEQIEGLRKQEQGIKSLGEGAIELKQDELKNIEQQIQDLKNQYPEDENIQQAFDPYADIKGQTAGLGVASFLVDKFGPKIGAAIFKAGKNKAKTYVGKNIIKPQIDKAINKIKNRKITTSSGGGGGNIISGGGGNKDFSVKGPDTSANPTGKSNRASQARGYALHGAEGGLAKFADGGRIGYKLGTGKKGVEGLIDLIRNKFGKKSITTADKAPIPSKTLERNMFEKTNERFNKTDSKVPEYDPKGRSQFEKDVEEAGGMEKFLDANPITEMAPKMIERLELKAKYPGITDDLLDKILIDDNMQRKAEILATLDEAFAMMKKGKGPDEVLNILKNMNRTKQADGGITRIGLKGGYLASGAKQLGKKYKGSTLSAILENPKLLGAELGHDGIMEVMRLLPSLFAEGGRAGFMAGGMGRIGYKAGSIDKIRRLFLKAIGAGTAGIGAAKSGIFSFGKGAGKEVAKEVVQKSTTTPPPYFFKLAEKIKMLGDDVTATTDRTISKSLKSKDGKSDYILEEDMVSGDTIIKKVNKENDEMITDVEIMEFKKGEVVMGKNGKPVKVPDNYEEVTEANARIEGDVFNDPYYSDGIEIDEIMKEVSEQAPSIKKASGGIARMLGE